MTESNPDKRPAPAASEGAVSAAKHASLKEKLIVLEEALVDRFQLDSGPSTADATYLALLRSSLAVERTLQAWIRTALSLISFGFTIGKLGQVVVALPGMSRHIGTDSMGYMLVTLGTLSLAMASVQHWLVMRSLRAQGLKREFSLAFGVAIILTLLGGFAFSALVLKL